MQPNISTNNLIFYVQQNWQIRFETLDTTGLSLDDICCKLKELDPEFKEIMVLKQ